MVLQDEEILKNEISANNSNIILFYNGIMNNMLLSVFVKYIDAKISLFPKISKKINKVLIELVQNIAYYSEERWLFDDIDKGIGIILIEEKSDHYIIKAGNKIKKEIGKNMLTKCRFINKLSIDELKNFKSTQRKEASLVENRCNIGLIQVALISSNKLEPEFINIDKQYDYYLLNIKFPKDTNLLN